MLNMGGTLSNYKWSMITKQYFTQNECLKIEHKYIQENFHQMTLCALCTRETRLIF